MPNTRKVVFLTTVGKKTTFFNTNQYTQIFRAGGVASMFLNTAAEASLFLTGMRKTISFITKSISPVFLTTNRKTMFLTTPNPNAPKELVLKIGTLVINADQTQITVPDGTGTYDPNDPTLNPGGFNPPSALYNPYRPYRTSVNLWTVYKVRSRPPVNGLYGNNTMSPNNQDPEADDPYIYTLDLPTEVINNEVVTIKGLYEIILVANPSGTLWASYTGTDVASIASTFPGWYVTSSPIIVDADLITCLNHMRYKFLQGVMCGKCDDEYLNFYGIYVGLLNAMEAGEWTIANEYYDKLKAICADSGNGCNVCNC